MQMTTNFSPSCVPTAYYFGFTKNITYPGPLVPTVPLKYKAIPAFNPPVIGPIKGRACKQNIKKALVL